MCLIDKKIIRDDNIKWIFEKIDHAQESYWKHSEAKYGIEEYSFESVSELEDKISEITGISPKAAKCLAIEAFKKYYIAGGQKKEQESKADSLPDFVYML